MSIFIPMSTIPSVTIPEIIPYSFRVSAPENTVSWFWDFGDGTTSEEANPVHGFDFMGRIFTYALPLPLRTAVPTATVHPSYISIRDTIPPPDCEAFFTWSVMESYPEQYAFQDLSRGAAPTAWFWDFGDGTFSTEQNPVHLFVERNDSLIGWDESGEVWEDSLIVPGCIRPPGS